MELTFLWDFPLLGDVKWKGHEKGQIHAKAIQDRGKVTGTELTYVPVSSTFGNL